MSRTSLRHVRWALASKAIGCVRSFSPVGPLHVFSRSLITGAATKEATAAVEQRSSAVMSYRHMGRSEFAVSGLAFGGDDRGSSIPTRMGRLHAAVTKKGCNTLFFDAEAIAARRDPASPLFTDRLIERQWERVALERLLSSDKISRSELVVVIKVALAGVPLSDGRVSDTAIAALRDKLVAALRSLDLECADIVSVTIPSSPSAFDQAAVAQLVHECEALVAAGFTQYYGMGAEAFSLVSPATDGSNNSSSNSSNTGVTGSIGQPLRPLLETVERVGGLGHHLVSISLPLNLSSPQPLLPLVVDATGKEWCLADLVASYGVTILARSPFDCVSAGEKKALRCQLTPEHRHSHPKRAIALLNDVLNFAIHCEVMWEKEIKAAVVAERELQRKTQTGPWTVAAPDPPGQHSETMGSVKALTDTGVVGDDSGTGETGPSSVVLPDDLVRTDVSWARILGGQVGKDLTLLEWQHMKARCLRPALRRLTAVTAGVDSVRDWFQGYVMLMGELTTRLDVLVEQAHAFKAASLQHALSAAVPQLAGEPLHRQVMRILLTAPSALLVTELPEAYSLVRRKARGPLPTEEETDVPSDNPAAADEADDTGRKAVPSEAPGVPGVNTPALEPRDMSGLDRKAVQSLLLAAPTAISRALATPIPDWEDPLVGIPTQAELAPAQEAMRKARRALNPTSSTRAVMPHQ